MSISVIDKSGLVKDGNYLVLLNPVALASGSGRTPSMQRYTKAMVFKVLSRQNSFGETYTTSLPTDTGTMFRSYDSNTHVASAAGCLPGMAYTSPGGLQFPMPGVENPDNMWDLDDTYFDRLFHTRLDVYPGFVRVGVDMPTGLNQARFQRTKKTVGIGTDVGWRYGGCEFVHIPEVDSSYQFGNTTNAELRPTCKFTFGEYIVGVPADPDIVFRVLTGKEPAYRVVMPITSYDSAISQGLRRTYGAEGFKIYPSNQYAAAIDDYSRVIAENFFSKVLV